MYGGVSYSIYNDLRVLDSDAMDWTVVLKDEERHDLYSRFTHAVGVLGNFLVAFGGSGAYLETTKSRQLFNDLVIFDLEKGDYVKFEGTRTAIEVHPKPNKKLIQACSLVKFDEA